MNVAGMRLLSILIIAVSACLSGCHSQRHRHVAAGRPAGVDSAGTFADPGQPATDPPVEKKSVRPVSLVQEAAPRSRLEPPRPASTAATVTLERLIQQALAGNPDLVTSAEQLAAADATLARARAEFYPLLGVSEQFGVSNNPVSAFMFQLNQRRLNAMQDFNNPATTHDFHTQLLVQHNVYSGERRMHEMHAAGAQSDAATLNLVALQNQLIFRVAEAYYRVLQARELVDVRREAVKQVEQHLRIVQARFDNQTAVKSDVLTVEVRLAEVRERLISAQNQLQLAWAVLENVVGEPIATRNLPDAIPPAPWSSRVDKVESAIAAALSDRAEVGALAKQRSAAEEGVLVAESGKRLGVDLVADYDVYTRSFDRGADSFFAGVVVQLNLFDGGRTQSEIARAAAKVRELQARERRLMLDIELDVRRAYLRLHDAESRLEVATQAIEHARESLREFEVRYRNQTATITQLIDAQVALSNTRVRRTSAEAELEIARADLQRAAGRLSDLIGADFAP